MEAVRERNQYAKGIIKRRRRCLHTKPHKRERSEALWGWEIIVFLYVEDVHPSGLGTYPSAVDVYLRRTLYLQFVDPTKPRFAPVGGASYGLTSPTYEFTHSRTASVPRLLVCGKVSSPILLPVSQILVNKQGWYL